MTTILKDKDYAMAFAMSGQDTYVDQHGQTWEKLVEPRERKEEESGKPFYGENRTRKKQNKLGDHLNLSTTATKEHKQDWVKRWRNLERDSQGEIIAYQNMGREQLIEMKKKIREQWVRKNARLSASLEGKDYASIFNRKRSQVGYSKAKEFIQVKARKSSLWAGHFKFLWVSEQFAAPPPIF